MKKIALSGGRTSARMLWELMESDPKFPEDYIITFCNTGKEEDKTLDFVRAIEINWGVKVVWLEYSRVPATPEIASCYPSAASQKTVLEQWKNRETTHWFKIVSYETAHRNGTPNGPFDQLLSWANVLPNVQTRICSVQMKVRTMMRYLFSLGLREWTDYIGIRYDESWRAGEIIANCPSYAHPNSHS